MPAATGRRCVTNVQIETFILAVAKWLGTLGPLAFAYVANGTGWHGLDLQTNDRGNKITKVRALPGHEDTFRVFQYAKAADRANCKALQADRVADAARGKPEAEVEALLDAAINAHLEAADKVNAFLAATAR